jgi:hypothetical protein
VDIIEVMDDLRRHRRRAASALRRAAAAESRDRTEKANRHLLDASDALRRAVHIADDADDVLELASALYRQARTAARLDLGDAAVAAARESAALYEQFDVTRGDPAKVAEAFESSHGPLVMLNHATGGITSLSESEISRGRARFIKRHAEARRLLSWCLAKYGTPGDGEAIRNLASRSVETVRELERVGAYTSRIDVAAAAAEYDQIVQALAKRTG